MSPLFILSKSAFAQVESLSNPTSVVSIFLSLLLVIVIVVALALLMRRFNVTATGNGQLHVVASMVAGTRERIMVIEVGDEQHLIGVTATNINHLAKLEKPLEKPTNSSADSFKDKLTQALAGKINPGFDKQNGQNND
ncbi:flagellar biosynthetic protein FliO [Aliiglaciecola sp. 2_MG-2023]|uniref:flagellar biosynthetic protein FliO n=1 Tax=Alteromonadaceae TaxID=72275 RepID=UPI0020904D4F|nr:MULTISPECIES: flagellar biosynthetic protein FliO [Aliiglaciecola]MDO6709393.1 flagellar biosynthetic protein FliO [Aliiglaciecola sp. 2_MG-2023]MDO6750541.1 flagellar biosynthetic protein FliO [Aliiglaciecola sp. 1_MG-2023]